LPRPDPSADGAEASGARGPPLAGAGLLQRLSDHLLERRRLPGGPGGGEPRGPAPGAVRFAAKTRLPRLAKTVLQIRHDSFEIAASVCRENDAAALSQRCRGSEV